MLKAKTLIFRCKKTHFRPYISKNRRPRIPKINILLGDIFFMRYMMMNISIDRFGMQQGVKNYGISLFWAHFGHFGTPMSFQILV